MAKVFVRHVATYLLSFAKVDEKLLLKCGAEKTKRGKASRIQPFVMQSLVVKYLHR